MPRSPICILLTLPLLLLAGTASAEQAVFPIAFEAPVHFEQTFELELPADVQTIHTIEVVLSGDFNGIIWLCNLETPDAFTGPGGLRFGVDAVPPTEPPAGVTEDWSAPTGPFEERYTLSPPEDDWAFLLEAGRMEFVVDEYVPASWDCWDRCPHGCSNVSGFEGLTALALVVDYDKAVAAGNPSWGTLKARW